MTKDKSHLKDIYENEEIRKIHEKARNATFDEWLSGVDYHLQFTRPKSPTSNHSFEILKCRYHSFPCDNWGCEDCPYQDPPDADLTWLGVLLWIISGLMVAGLLFYLTR